MKVAEQVLAVFECPSCHEPVQAIGVFGMKNTHMDKGKFVSVKVVMRGVKISHDCTKDEDNDGDTPGT